MSALHLQLVIAVMRATRRHMLFEPLSNDSVCCYISAIVPTNTFHQTYFSTRIIVFLFIFYFLGSSLTRCEAEGFTI